MRALPCCLLLFPLALCAQDPLELEAVPQEDGVQLRWRAHLGASSFEVVRSLCLEDDTLVCPRRLHRLTAPASSLLDAEALPGIVWDYRVVAYDAEGRELCRGHSRVGPALMHTDFPLGCLEFLDSDELDPQHVAVLVQLEAASRGRPELRYAAPHRRGNGKHRGQLWRGLHAGLQQRLLALQGTERETLRARIDPHCEPLWEAGTSDDLEQIVVAYPASSYAEPAARRWLELTAEQGDEPEILRAGLAALELGVLEGGGLESFVGALMSAQRLEEAAYLVRMLPGSSKLGDQLDGVQPWLQGLRWLGYEIRIAGPGFACFDALRGDLLWSLEQAVDFEIEGTVHPQERYCLFNASDRQVRVLVASPESSLLKIVVLEHGQLEAWTDKLMGSRGMAPQLLAYQPAGQDVPALVLFCSGAGLDLCDLYTTLRMVLRPHPLSGSSDAVFHFEGDVLVMEDSGERRFRIIAEDTGRLIGRTGKKRYNFFVEKLE